MNLPTPLECLPNTYRPFFGHFLNLSDAQKALINPILQGNDIILQAGTGSGKTEAVLAPATENLITSSNPYTIIYIVPTKALALDMNRRIKPLYKQLGLKAGIRTGDGKNLWNAKPDLLIMTPESLDVLLGSNNQDNRYFIKHLHTMIIDEVHVYLNKDRGHQLTYLHNRIQKQSIGPLQTIALSATIPDIHDTALFFNLKSNLFSFKQLTARKLHPCWVHIDNQEKELPFFFDDLMIHFKCTKILLFVNTRRTCEEIFHLLSQSKQFADYLWIHYSNLSTKERRSIESEFRKSKKGICIATTTLELGIDIGDVDGVVLFGPPSSSMSFLQRIGRGNRRQKHINFWGICSGPNANSQLIKFLALHDLAKENQVEAVVSSKSYSVLMQQVISNLYAQKILSFQFLEKLFNEKSKELREIINHMLINKWIKSTKHQELYEGGGRYFIALQKRQLWSNFPHTSKDYDVILNQEKIAEIPAFICKQIDIGDRIQLTGRVLKILKIEEKKTSNEVLVEKSAQEVSKDLFWAGFGPPTSFEVAQKMKAILFEDAAYKGILNRTKRMLDKTKKEMEKSTKQQNGMYIRRLENGGHRYDTFLGTVGNIILSNLIKTQLSKKIEELMVSFDEIGIETNESIPFDHLKFPLNSEQLEKWVSLNLSLLRASFPWNSWLHYLPQKYQVKEIFSHLYDPRIFQAFTLYQQKIK